MISNNNEKILNTSVGFPVVGSGASEEESSEEETSGEGCVDSLSMGSCCSVVSEAMLHFSENIHQSVIAVNDKIVKRITPHCENYRICAKIVSGFHLLFKISNLGDTKFNTILDYNLG